MESWQVKGCRFEPKLCRSRWGGALDGHAVWLFNKVGFSDHNTTSRISQRVRSGTSKDPAWSLPRLSPTSTPAPAPLQPILAWLDDQARLKSTQAAHSSSGPTNVSARTGHGRDMWNNPRHTRIRPRTPNLCSFIVLHEPSVVCIAFSHSWSQLNVSQAIELSWHTWGPGWEVVLCWVMAGLKWGAGLRVVVWLSDSVSIVLGKPWRSGYVTCGWRCGSSAGHDGKETKNH